MRASGWLPPWSWTSGLFFRSLEGAYDRSDSGGAVYDARSSCGATRGNVVAGCAMSCGVMGSVTGRGCIAGSGVRVTRIT